ARLPPGEDRERPERGDEAPDRDRVGAAPPDLHRRAVRAELRPHARAALALGLLRLVVGLDRRHDDRPDRLLQVEEVDLGAHGRGHGGRYPGPVPYYICPNCKERSIDTDGLESLLDRQAVGCHHCGFGFLFELMEDYYPGPNTGFVVCDQQGRILAAGRGVFELTGWPEDELMGHDVVARLGLDGFPEGKNPVALALEWGVRR